MRRCLLLGQPRAFARAFRAGRPHSTVSRAHDLTKIRNVGIIAHIDAGEGGRTRVP